MLFGVFETPAERNFWFEEGGFPRRGGFSVDRSRSGSDPVRITGSRLITVGCWSRFIVFSVELVIYWDG